MTIAIPDNRVLTLVAKDGGGFQSEGLEVTPVPDGSTIWGDYIEITQPAATIFSDSFATGDLSHTENGASWGAQTATSLVSGDGCVIFSSGGSVVDPPSCGFESRQWEGLTNNNAMRFRYGLNEAFPMQEWSLNEPATRVRDIWIKLTFRVPKDYEHVNNSGSSTNNKFFALFMDGREAFSDGGATVVFQTRERSGNNGSSFVVYCWNSAGGNGDFASFTDFISVPTDGGVQRDDRTRWMDGVVLHIQANTAGPGTGLVEAYRRWQDEEGYSQLFSVPNRDIPLPSSGYDGWNTAQIVGGDNSWLAEGTEILMDGFYCSESPLVPAGTEGL